MIPVVFCSNSYFDYFNLTLGCFNPLFRECQFVSCRSNYSTDIVYNPVIIVHGLHADHMDHLGYIVFYLYISNKQCLTIDLKIYYMGSVTTY